VSHSGSAADSSISSGPLCLLTGHVENAAVIDAEWGARPGSSVEQALAAGYLRRGAELLESLRGEFVLLIWDSVRGEGLIARDQLGVHCLYLHDDGGGVLRFATEVRELLELLPRRPAPDPAGLAHWLAASSRAGEGTLYEGVRRLAPGGVLLLDGRGVRERRYWRPTFTEPVARSRPELASGVREGIDRAVRRRLVGGEDGGVASGEDGGAAGGLATGVLMSGGLDSAAVAAVAARAAPGRVVAYSGVFPEYPAVDESELIGLLRGELALPGVNVEVRSGGLLASALASQRVWQLPLLSWGDFWTQPLLSAASRAGVQVVLGGDGGDELFATRVYLLADRLRAGTPRRALGLARELPGAGDRPPRRELLRVAAQLALGGAMPYRPHEVVRRPFAARELPAWLTRRSASELLTSSDPLAWKRLDGPRWWAHAAHGLTSGIEQAGIFELHRHRAALAGLEARHPLFDLDLIELVLGQPPLSSFDRYRNRPLLRASMVGLLPDAVRLRKQKALFDPLILDTLAGPDGMAVRQLLCDPRAELGAYVDLTSARRSLLEDRSLQSRRPFDWMQQVWRLVTAECWLRAQADPKHDRLSDFVRASSPRVNLHDTSPRVSARPPTPRLTLWNRHTPSTFFHLDALGDCPTIPTYGFTDKGLKSTWTTG
jgi:asparagine synthase (glutamine-hydrolysing)